MKKITTAIFFLLASVQLVVAQNDAIPALTDQAIKAYKMENFEHAKELINQSIKSVDGEADAYTWHFRGHIHRHFFNKNVGEEVDNSNREEVIKSFKKSISLDDVGTFKKSNIDGLVSIANSFWNEAVQLVNDRDKTALGSAENKFKRFVDLRKEIGEETNIKQYTINFYKAYASANRKLIDVERKKGNNIEAYGTELEKVEYAYKKVLDINKEDYVSNYNLSINLYNEGAFMIEQLPDEASIIDLIGVQGAASEVFIRALPYALKADNIKPGRIETVKALRAIYLALNDYKKFDHYNQIVKKIMGSSGLGDIDSEEKFKKHRENTEKMKNQMKNINPDNPDQGQ